MKREVKEALSHFVMRLGEKLRRDGLMTSQLSFFIQTSPHSKTQAYYGRNVSTTLAYPTDYTPDLLLAADRLLERSWKQGLAYVKCGVMAVDLSPTSRFKADLLDKRDQPREARLMKAMGVLNADYGARTVRFGSMGQAKPAWKMRADLKSQNYTTQWKDVLCIP